MKPLISLIVLLILMQSTGYSQNFSEKTNAIKLDYNKPIEATPLPSISWVTPRLDQSISTESSITFEAEIQSDVPLKSVRFEWSNGDESKSKSFSDAEGESKKSIHQSVTLIEGENIIRIFAENRKGGIVSSSRSVLFGKDLVADAVDINRKDYALIIATDNYDNFDDLVNPVNDGKTIEAILKEDYGFQTELLENATNNEILDKITDYNERKFNPQDQLFIFFAGHGVFDETLGEGYVVASNSLSADRGKSSYVSHVLIRERLNNIKCEHIFLMMDVCFGGTIDPVLAKSRSAITNDETIDRQYLVKKLTKRTRKFLTSGSKEYVSDGIRGKHSPFAEKFILALKEIGGGTGRILSLVELRTYFLKLNSEPRFGSFGTDDPASDFVFVAKQ